LLKGNNNGSCPLKQRILNFFEHFIWRFNLAYSFKGKARVNHSGFGYEEVFFAFAVNPWLVWCRRGGVWANNI
jgi:hypothetical protein